MLYRCALEPQLHICLKLSKRNWEKRSKALSNINKNKLKDTKWKWKKKTLFHKEICKIFCIIITVLSLHFFVLELRWHLADFLSTILHSNTYIDCGCSDHHIQALSYLVYCEARVVYFLSSSRSSRRRSRRPCFRVPALQDVLLQDDGGVIRRLRSFGERARVLQHVSL